MQCIKIDYSNDVLLTDESKSHIDRAEICRNIICENRPFSEKQLKRISDFFRTPLTWSSSAIEGSTYTMGETQTLLEYGTTIHGKSLKETLEICGHADAFDYMIKMAGTKGLDAAAICHLHALIYGKVDTVAAGAYKTEQNFITGSAYTTVRPSEVLEEMKKLEKWISDNYDKLHPIVLATEVHRKLVYIHPFDDGNGRCARLCMNVILLQNGYLPCSISPALRLDYINSLEAGRNGDINEFIRFVAEAETETQKDYMRALDIPLPKLPAPVSEFEKRSSPLRHRL